MPRAIDPVSGDRIESEAEVSEREILESREREEARVVEETIRYEHAAFLDEYPREYAAA